MAEWETAPSRTKDGWEEAPSRFSETVKNVLGSAERRDEGIDYATGISSPVFRSGFSRMSSDDERANYLDMNVGKGLWGKDSFGAYYLQPEGAAKFGVKSDKPVSIDEQSVTTSDVADWAGDAPAIAGGVGMGMAATGLGLPAGLALAGLGAAGGKAIDEVVKNVQGYRKREAGEIAGDLAIEGALAGGGELAARGIKPVAKWLAGPQAKRMTPERAEAARSAQEQGFHVRPGQVTDAPLLARWEGMVQMIFGDLYKAQNLRAAEGGISRLGGMAGASPGREGAGQILADSLKAERTKFGMDMSAKYSQIDKLVGQPFVPTDPLKRVAQDILDSMPKTESGEVVFASPETQKFLNAVMQLQPLTTANQMQQVRTILREASESSNLVPGIDKHHARLLRKAADEAFTSAGATGAEKQAVDLMRLTDAEYKSGIRRFSNPLVSRITRDASKSGSIDPDQVVEHVIKPNYQFRVRQIKNAVSPEAWAKVKAAHAEDLLQNVVKGTDNPFESIFDGRAFRDTLNNYGRGTLNEVHGKEWTDAAYKYANALMLAGKKAKQSGGIVAANIALHPVANLPKLVWLRVLEKYMESPGGFKYLTQGIQFGPETKAGAEALTRFTTQLVALAEDETGSARINVTEPPN